MRGAHNKMAPTTLEEIQKEFKRKKSKGNKFGLDFDTAHRVYGPEGPTALNFKH